MNIQQRTQLKSFARQQLEPQPEAKKIILIYSALTLGLSLAVTAANFILDLQIDQTGGLRNMGTRAVLDSLMQMLPMVQSVIALCLELGYCAAMLRIARGQYVSSRTLKLGFDRFWPLLRLSILRGLILLGAGFASIYLGTMVYMLTPFSDPAMAILTPVMENAATMDASVLLDAEIYSQLLSAMAPCFLICGILGLAVVIPLWYRYRLAGYVLIDNPGWGALMCLRQSRILMHRNRLHLFKLDLSFWYYHGALLLAGFVAYGDVLLSLLGVTVPMGAEVAFFLFYVLYLLCQLALYFFLRNAVEVSYCLAYESLKPEPPKENAVVLGNIFQM